MLFAAGCSNSTTSQQTQKFKIKVAALKGPTGIGMVKLMEDNKSDYDISIYNSPDQIVSKIVSGEVDIAAVPSNLAAVLYNKTNGKVKLAGINTLGMLYIVENGNSIKNYKRFKRQNHIFKWKGSCT